MKSLCPGANLSAEKQNSRADTFVINMFLTQNVIINCQLGIPFFLQN
jgi:hypothetical protein